jgi:hypothetical protein
MVARSRKRNEIRYGRTLKVIVVGVVPHGGKFRNRHCTECKGNFAVMLLLFWGPPVRHSLNQILLRYSQSP